MDKDAYKNGTVPVAGSLYEESQAMMFAGGDTTGNTLMLATYYLLKQPDTYQSLKAELEAAWPNLQQPPSLRELEQMPYLNAVIKEGLRMSSGVVSGLLRIVPSLGATICDTFVPAGVSPPRLWRWVERRCADVWHRQLCPVAVHSYTSIPKSFLALTNLNRSGG